MKHEKLIYGYTCTHNWMEAAWQSQLTDMQARLIRLMHGIIRNAIPGYNLSLINATPMLQHHFTVIVPVGAWGVSLWGHGEHPCGGMVSVRVGCILTCPHRDTHTGTLPILPQGHSPCPQRNNMQPAAQMLELTSLLPARDIVSPQ